LTSLLGSRNLLTAKVVVGEKYVSGFDVLMAQGGAFEFVKTVPDETFQLVATSLPGMPSEERLEFRNYLGSQEKVLMEFVRVLKPGGSLCVQSSKYVNRKEVCPLDLFLYPLVRKNPNMQLRNRIVWFRDRRQDERGCLRDGYQPVLWFTKGHRYTFNLDAVRMPQKYPDKKYFRGPKKGQLSCNPLGKNPGDAWEVLKVKADYPDPSDSWVQLPIHVARRLVLAMSNQGDVVFDPFAGTGSILLAGILLGRRVVGVNSQKRYARISERRINQAIQGKLTVRDLYETKENLTAY